MGLVRSARTRSAGFTTRPGLPPPSPRPSPRVVPSARDLCGAAAQVIVSREDALANS